MAIQSRESLQGATGGGEDVLRAVHSTPILTLIHFQLVSDVSTQDLAQLMQEGGQQSHQNEVNSGACVAEGNSLPFPVS